ncbi:MAG: hypothetical protein P9M15_00355, partial [Candidatus Electryoneaceae bacterium]|nr:hypothetical protein [Candidatus Electryoneaceae bacterium]
MVEWQRSGRTGRKVKASVEPSDKKTGEEQHKPDEPVQPVSTEESLHPRRKKRGWREWAKEVSKFFTGRSTPKEETGTGPKTTEHPPQEPSVSETDPPSGGTGEEDIPEDPSFVDIYMQEIGSLYGSCSNHYTVTMFEVAGENSKFNTQVIWEHKSGNHDAKPTGLREALNQHHGNFNGMSPPVVYIILGKSVNDAVRGVVTERKFIPEEWDYGEEERVLLKWLMSYSGAQSEDDLRSLLDDICARETAFQLYLTRRNIETNIPAFLKHIGEKGKGGLDFLTSLGKPLAHPITNPDHIPQINFIGPMDLEKMFGISVRPPDGMIFIVCRPNLHDKKREEELKKLAQVTVHINGQEERTVYWYEDVPLFTVGSSVFDNIVVNDFTVFDSVFDGISFVSEMPYKPLLFSLKFDEMADPFDSNPGASFPNDPHKISYNFRWQQREYAIKSAYDPVEEQAFFDISRVDSDGKSTELMSLTFDFIFQSGNGASPWPPKDEIIDPPPLPPPDPPNQEQPE